VLHFLTDQPSRRHYLTTLAAATKPGSLAIIAAFAPDGPKHCSGLPVHRYSAHDLAEFLGDPWHLVRAQGEQHTTPFGAQQPFTWSASHRLS
jgi:hypothetical protein